MAITDKEQGVWELDQVYNKINEGGIWSYDGFDPSSLFVWGRAEYGGLGLNTPDNTDQSSPVQIPGTDWQNVAYTRGSFMAGVKTDGTLWAWGANPYGALGQNDKDNRSSPVQVPGTTWKYVAAGEKYIMVTKTDGTLWTWGNNGDGQLGINNATAYSSPIQLPGTTYDRPFSSAQTSMVLKTDGTLWAWGKNTSGQCGTNTPQYAARSSPLQIGTDTNWNLVSNAQDFTVATKTDGTLWIWGNNEHGQLGLNEQGPSTTWQSSPCQLPGTDWSTALNASTASTQAFAGAIKTDGTLWTWGDNLINTDNAGMLGQNNTTNYSSPVQVPGTTWANVASSYYTFTATKTDGTAWSWGGNEYGALGQNSPTPGDSQRSSPVQIGTNTNWTGTSGSGADGGPVFLYAQP